MHSEETMSHKAALIGIDWGTHSSKWIWTPSQLDSPVLMRNMLMSEVRVEQPSGRILLGVESPPSDSISEHGIKGKIINDPGASFWDGPRASKLTLGDLVSFSLWFLLGEAYQNLCDKTDSQPDELDVRFSLPNWVGIDRAFARSRYDQAAQVACHIFVRDRQAWARGPYPDRDGWRDCVGQALATLEISDFSERKREHEDFQLLLDREPLKVGEGVKIRFVAESSGAGLTGLRYADTKDEMEKKKYKRKILVVDVGAGSTDIGYVIRSVSPRGSDANEFLCQFPPAGTCAVAGNDLSRRLQEIYRRRGKEIAFEEAENEKTLGSDTQWLDDPTVHEWKASIASHVRTYVSEIRDDNFLYSDPGLDVLVTGGSGSVAGLRDQILEACVTGLRRRPRRVPREVIDLTRLMELRLEGVEAVDVNRLAVAIGAAREDFPSLRYRTNLDAPERTQTVRPVRSWTR
jgi:hypothetical protein